MVATCLVTRFTEASRKSTAVITPRPSGSSLPSRGMLNGTFHSRGAGCVKRSTITASDLNANDQITPKA